MAESLEILNDPLWIHSKPFNRANDVLITSPAQESSALPVQVGMIPSQPSILRLSTTNPASAPLLVQLLEILLVRELWDAVL